MNSLNSVTSSTSEVKYPPSVGCTRGLSADMDNERLYDTKPNKKVTRIFTVVLYMFSVSLGAILLSLYYVFLWKNPHTRNYLHENKDIAVKTTPESIMMSEPPLALQLDSDPQIMLGIPTAFPKLERGVPPLSSWRQRSVVYVEVPPLKTFKYTRPRESIAASTHASIPKTTQTQATAPVRKLNIKFKTITRKEAEGAQGEEGEDKEDGSSLSFLLNRIEPREKSSPFFTKTISH